MSKSKKTSVAATLSGVFDTMQNRISDLDTKVDAITTNAAKGFVEQKQAIADNAAGTSYALDALKDSSQRSFDNVAKDIKATSDSAQRHNARISKLEGGANTTALDLVGIRCQQLAFDDRLARLESKTAPVVSTTTSSLETALKNLLKSYGYDVDLVSISKSDRSYQASIMEPMGKVQSIEIKVGGSKKL